LEEECLSRHEFASYAEAYATVVDFIRFYNENRIHSATKYLVRPGKAVSDSGCDAHLEMPNQQPVASPWSLPGNCQA